MQNTEQTQQSTRHSLAKIDKSKYTKQEWHQIRERRRKEKQAKKLLESTKIANQPLVTDSNKNYVVCLKHGSKYGANYVNTLYSMVKRNLTLPFEFVCFTEDPRDLDPEIRVEELPNINSAHGWWYKMSMFNPNLPLKGNLLFIDLDVIIFKNIDKLFTYEPGKFCIIRDFNRSLRKDWKKFNSSVFRLRTGQFPNVWRDFTENSQNMIARYHGDQDVIYHYISQMPTSFLFWPDEWIQSYKWEMRDRKKLVRYKDGTRNFSQSEDPTIKQQTSIAVFHGQPFPHDCIDQWCKDNWK